MACESWRGRVEAYVDGELPESQQRDFGAHLNGCGSCSAEVLALLQQKRLVQAAGKRYSAAPEFRRRIVETVLVQSRTSSQSWFHRWAPYMAMAAVLLVSLAGLSYWRQQTEREQILGELADLHVTDLASSNPVDVVSSDRHTVKPWFQGRLPFSFDLPELQNSPFTLVGGRVAYLKHEPGAHLVYEVRKHRISVFIFREADSLRRLKDSAARGVLSFKTESWTSGGLRYFVIGDASPQDIRSLSDLHKAAAIY